MASVDSVKPSSDAMLSLTLLADLFKSGQWPWVHSGCFKSRVLSGVYAQKRFVLWLVSPWLSLKLSQIKSCYHLMAVSLPVVELG